MMDHLSNYEAPELSIAMEDVKKEYLTKIRKYHKSNPEYFSIFKNNYTIDSIINNNLYEWEHECLKQAFINCDLLENDKIKVSYTGWVVAGFGMVIEELVTLSSNYYLIKIDDNYNLNHNLNYGSLSYHEYHKFPLLFYIKKYFPKINFSKIKHK